MNNRKKLACAVATLIVAVASTAAAADWKQFHGMTFRCFGASSDHASCDGVQPSQNGFFNNTASEKTVAAPLLRDGDGNLDVDVLFKANTRKGTFCYVIWYDVSGLSGSATTIPQNGGAVDELRAPFVAAPWGSPTIVLCNMKPAAVITSVEYGEGG